VPCSSKTLPRATIRDVEREATRFAEIVKDLKPTEVTVSQVGDVKPGSPCDDQLG